MQVDISKLKAPLVEYLTGMELYSYQIALLNDNSQFRYILKSRQTGISWLMAQEAILDCLYNEDYVYLFTSRSQRQSKNLMRYVRHTLKGKNVPLDTSSTIETIFSSTGSMIVSLPNSPDTIRGYAANKAAIDEFAFFSNYKEVMEAIMPSTIRGEQLTILSTPNGKQGSYWDIYREIQKGGSEYSFHRIHWSQCPDLVPRIPAIRRAMEDISFRQEYECEFVDESMAFFTYELIMSCVDDTLEVQA